jgi:hypothetical protein
VGGVERECEGESGVLGCFGLRLRCERRIELRSQEEGSTLLVICMSKDWNGDLFDSYSMIPK